MGVGKYFIERFKAFAQQEKLLSKDRIFLVTVSAGVDSVVLAKICAQLEYQICIVHCNFQLRGEDSEADELFVENLAKELNVPFYSKRFDTKAYKEKFNVSTQVAARKLRYNYFNELADAINKEQKKKVSILTAHHKDDNIETSLMYLFRGSGIKGLLGVSAKKGLIERPLLFASKQEIKEYASENNITYRDDVSNASNDYTRNLLRNKIIPDIETHFPDFKIMMSKDIELFKDVYQIYKIGIEQKIKRLVKVEDEAIKIPVLRLQKMEAGKACLHEILQPLGFTVAQEIEVRRLCDAETGKYVLGPNHRVIRNRNWLLIVPNAVEAAAAFVVENTDSAVQFQNGLLQFQITEDLKISDDKKVALLDYRSIKFPLVLRKWRQGDYFYPLGMNKKKKLSKFLIDEKYALHQKENVWVLESDQKIIWIVGARIDDRFRINTSTTTALKITLTLPS